MPFSLQDFNSVSSRPKSGINTKPSNTSVTKNLKKTLQLNKDIDVFNPKTGREFTIVSGMQEYAIRRYNDVYIVKPCSSKYTDTNIEISPLKPSETKDSVLSSTKKSSKNRAQSAKILNNEEKKVTFSLPLSKQESSEDTNKFVMKDIKLKRTTWKENSILNKKSRDFYNHVNQAVKLQKIFSIGNQNRRAFPSIREALTSRGWVEKCSAEVLSEEESIHTKIAEVTIRLLKDTPVNFIWVINSVDFSNVKDDTIISRFPKNNHFTTKVGLCSFLEDFHWFYEPNVSQTISPRTFKIANGDDVDNFIKEFGLTACVSLLKIVVKEVATAESDHFFKNGKVPITIVDFANCQCSEFIIFRQHDDIDRVEDYQVTAKEWTDFLYWFYQVAHEKQTFQTTTYPMIQALYTMSKLTLKNIEPYWPQLELEGCKNLWVVKPSAQFCGRGVRVMKNLEDIINHLDISTDNKVSRHIVQKYIEHPLLIYKTKFDIRQWFLVTSVYPLTIWIYKECYLRFSSQPFLLDNLHESIHLTNNAIQRNYANNHTRDPKLPQENMWHCTTFQEYLSAIGEPEKWVNVILPGIKQGIIGTVLASQDEMIDRQNSFELYGADFLLGSDFTPILLEINMGPSMAPSTNITADLCKRGLQDIIKVALDVRHNPKADTGKFELLFKQEMGQKQHHIGLDLVVNGSKIVPERKVKQPCEQNNKT